MGDYPWSRGLHLTEESKLSWMDQKEVSPPLYQFKQSIKTSTTPPLYPHIRQHFDHSGDGHMISPPFHPVSTPRLIVDDDLSPSNKHSNNQSNNGTKFPLSMFRRRSSTSSTDTDESNKSVGHAMTQTIGRTKQDLTHVVNNQPLNQLPTLTIKPMHHTSPTLAAAPAPQPTTPSLNPLPPLNPHPRCATNERQQLYSTFTRSLDAVTSDSEAVLVKPQEGELLPYHLCGDRVELVGPSANSQKREKSVFDRVILVVETIVLTSPADNAGLRVGDWIVAIGDVNADNWHPDRLDEVATLVRQWPRAHRREKLKIQVLRRVKGEEAQALPKNAQVMQARCMVANPQSDDTSESKFSLMTLNLQVLSLYADICLWSMADVMSRDSGGVLGACLALFPQPKSNKARAQTKPAVVKAAPAQPKYVHHPSAPNRQPIVQSINQSASQTIKPIHKQAQVKKQRSVVETKAESIEDPNQESGWRRVSDSKNRRSQRKHDHVKVQITSY